MKLLLAITVLFLAAATCCAAHEDPAAPHNPAEAEHPHPEVAPPARWPGVVVLVIGGLFVAAVAVGLTVRANMPVEPPQAHTPDQGHHEDSQGHGGPTAGSAHH